MFFGRKKELLWLSDFYKSNDVKIACIYGRVGIGKTALTKHFTEDKPHFYYNSYATTGRAQMEILARTCGYLTELSDTLTPAEHLAMLLEKNIIKEDNFILVIDSFSNFIKSDGDFEEVLLTFVKEKNLKLILLGDSYLQTSKLLFDKKSKWSKQKMVSMELTQLGYYESRQFLADVKDPLEQAFIYGATGGIPAQLIKAVSDRTKTIQNIFFDAENSALLPESTIQSELRELSYYNHILSTLAAGHNRVNQISKQVNKPKDVVVPYMNTLMSIGVVTKENPVTEKTNRKKTRYSIVNSFDLFWYAFMASRIELVYEKDIQGIMEKSIEPNLSAFMNRVFVSMCREYLEVKSARGELPFVIEEIGNWWQNDDENQTSFGFDLVAIGKEKEEETMMFARCYYNDEPVGIATLKELIDLTKRVHGKKNVFYLVFSKSGFHENTTTVAATIKNIILVSLEDIING